MALGKQNYVNDGKFYILRLVREQVDKSGKKVPVEPNQFLVSEKTGEKEYTAVGLEKNVSGDLVAIHLEKDEYEGNEYDKVKLILRDDKNKESYLLDLRQTGLSRNLFNSLFALESYEGLSISTYLKEGKDGKQYSNISLWQNNTLVKGKYPWSEWPVADEIKDKKGVVVKRDFSEVDAWFIEKLTVLAEKVNKKSATPNTTTEDAQTDAPVDDPSEVVDSEVPF